MLKADWPAGQGVQDEAPATEVWPTGHVVQVLEPAREYWPATQGTHVVLRVLPAV